MRSGVPLVAAVVAALAAPAPAPACAISVARDVVLTPEGAELALDGGVILSTSFGLHDPTRDLHVRTVGSKHPAVTVEIAPLLRVVRPPIGARVEVVDGRDQVVRTLTFADPSPKALAAPAIATLTSTARAPSPRAVTPYAIPSSALEIGLRAEPPEDAQALVIYEVDGKTTTPHAWIAVAAKTTSYTIVTGGKPCHASTALPTYQGTTLRFAWLDRGGRLSPLSAAVRVGVAN